MLEYLIANLSIVLIILGMVAVLRRDATGLVRERIRYALFGVLVANQVGGDRPGCFLLA